MMNPWLSISTAPKDRWLIVFSQDSGCRIALWDNWYKHWFDYDTDSSGKAVPIKAVTHWMPLPEDPA